MTARDVPDEPKRGADPTRRGMFSRARKTPAWPGNVALERRTAAPAALPSRRLHRRAYFGAALFRRQDADDPLALVRGRRLDLADFFQLLDDVVDHLAAFFDVGHFAAAEDDRDDHLVLVLQETCGPGSA